MIFALLGAMFDSLLKYKPNKSSTASKMAYRRNWSQNIRGDTDAAIAFANITSAHCCAEDIVDEFGMAEEGGYIDPELGVSPWDQAYNEAIEEVMAAAALIGCDPEDLIDWDEVEENAYDYACDFAQRMMDNQEWIPDEDMLLWAFYDVSDHNG